MNNLHMNYLQKYLSTCLLATVALVGGISPGWAATAPPLGPDLASFAVLGGSAVTCTNTPPPTIIIGDVGVSPTRAFTNTGCTITGGTPPATDAAADRARVAFPVAFAALNQNCDTILDSTIPASRTLLPGTYCTSAGLTATSVTLTLDAGAGNANAATAVWIFKVGTNPSGTGALTGTSFNVVMANGGQPCNVFWRVAQAASMTDSNFIGTILAGAAITMTRGTFAGGALANANVAVTITGTAVTGCGGLAALSGGGSLVCKIKKVERDEDDEDENDHDRDHDKDHHDRDHDKDHDRDHHKDHDRD